jgi:hypothetical protein
MDEQEKIKRLKLVRFWLFGTFVIVVVAVTAYVALWVGGPYTLGIVWPIWAITLVACVVFYFGYKMLYLDRQ